MSARHIHLREAARLRLLAANTTTPLMKTRLLAQAVEHERRAEAVPRGAVNGLRGLAAWHRSCAKNLDGDERERRLELAEQIEQRADELDGWRPPSPRSR